MRITNLKAVIEEQDRRDRQFRITPDVIAAMQEQDRRARALHDGLRQAAIKAAEQREFWAGVRARVETSRLDTAAVMRRIPAIGA